MPRILLVDDDELLRELLELTLSLEGHEVALASNGVEGIELVRRERFDLALLDLMMPFMDGVRFLRTLDAESADPPPVIVMSAAGTGELAREVLDAGAKAVVQKPVDIEALLATIGGLLPGRTLG
ncbi:MAG: response regulator [Pseudomonadota bacterium]